MFDGVSVPWVPAALALPALTPVLRERCLVTVGVRAEVDLAALATLEQAGEVPDGSCERLVCYWMRCRSFHNAPSLAGPAVTVAVPLVSARQLTGRPKKDLTAEYEALLTLGPAGDVLTSALSANVDPARVERAAAAFSGSVQLIDSGIEVSVSLWRDCWPPPLGGVPLAGEVARRVTVVAKHAAWRDRAQRRLSLLRVDSVQLWPDPAATAGD